MSHPTPSRSVTLESGARLNLYPHPASEPVGRRHRGAIVVCPGGAYARLAPHEGEPIARWLNEAGLHAAVLHYRHGEMGRHPAPLEDALAAIAHVRRELADRVGILGFSAGGHLAATVATHRHADAATRPDVAVLCYAVTFFTEPYAHTGSRDNLLGSDHNPALARSLDAHRNVTADTPPTFLFHTVGDPVVPVDHALAFAAACRRAGVRHAMHICDHHGAHGVGLAGDVPSVSGWTDHCAQWLALHGLVPKD